MSEIPEIPDAPDEFTSKEEISEYIEQLHEHIDSLEEGPEKYEEDKMELRRELIQLRDDREVNRQEMLTEIVDSLVRLSEKVADVRDRQKDRGNLDGSVADTVSDITGEDYP